VLRLLPVLLLLARPAAAAETHAVAPALLAALAAAGVPLALWLAWRQRRLHRRLREAMARNARLTAGLAGLRGTLDTAEARVKLLDNVLESLTDGIAVVDADYRLACWNARFPEVTGVPRRALRIGLSFSEVVRLQAEAGEFGLVDPEAETERRMQLLRQGKMMGRWQRERPDGSRIELRRAALPGGGFVTLYTPVEKPRDPEIPGLAEAVRAEWSARVPRLIAAAADGDAAAVRAAAHALRGIAANAGWTGPEAQLAEVEAAAERGDLREARIVASLLLTDTPW
jgi:PAS domain-containing protein